MTAYSISPDGDDEPTLWATTDADVLEQQPRAVMRRCDNAEAFDLLLRLLDGLWSGTNH